MRKKVLAFSGSIRRNSANESILQFIGEAYREKMEFKFYEQLADLPFFTPGINADRIPPIVSNLLHEIESSDGVIICTPEYVFSLPGVLKNALEWTVATTVFLNKPAAIIVASAAGEKTFESLMLIMTTLGARIETGAALLIQGVRSKVKDGTVSDDLTKKEIDRMMHAFMMSLEDSKFKD